MNHGVVNMLPPQIARAKEKPAITPTNSKAEERVAVKNTTPIA
jgi:hypothetical protein